MTTHEPQQRLIDPSTELRFYEETLTLHLKRLAVWTTLPDERTDWALEALLGDIADTALAIRRLRGEADVPF